jgi:hypothetical protein
VYGASLHFFLFAAFLSRAGKRGAAVVRSIPHYAFALIFEYSAGNH